MFMSVFSFVVAGAGDSFITVVLVSFFYAGGVTVVSFCSQAANSAAPASRQMYFFIQTIRIWKDALPSRHRLYFERQLILARCTNHLSL